MFKLLLMSYAICLILEHLEHLEHNEKLGNFR